MGNGQGQAGVLGGTSRHVAGAAVERNEILSLFLRLLPSPKPCSSAPSTSASSLPFILVLSSSSFFSISRKTQSVLMVKRGSENEFLMFEPLERKEVSVIQEEVC